MTQPEPTPAEEATSRTARLLGEALAALQHDALVATGLDEARRELSESRLAMDALARRLELQLAEEREQRLVLATQLTGLAASLERLVGHLQGLSQVMANMIERAPEPEPAPTPPAAAIEPAFQPGGEGLSLTLAGVPGFQALMDIQKALMAMEPVAGVSVERFQEGDSRLLVHLVAAVTGEELANALRTASGHVFTVEESRPELQSLRLKRVG